MAFPRRGLIAIGFILLATACTTGAPEASPTTTAPTTTTSVAPTTSVTSPPPEPVLDPEGAYAVVAFTNHLPAYGRTESGALDRPWPRLHTTRDYLTMTRLIAEADAKVVLSFSASLLEAIAETATGTPDRAAELTAKPAIELTQEDKDYLDEVFFTASADQIERFPRYRDLADRRAAGRALSSTDYRDLQVLFNLAWTSPLLLEEEPLLSLAAKGQNFSSEDKATVLETHRNAVGEFLDSLVALQAAGKIELATAPMYDPTLPFLIRNRMDSDAAMQIAKAATAAADILGTEVAGLAPRRGLIDQANSESIAAAGFEWALLSAPEPTQPVWLTSERGDLLGFPASGRFGTAVATDYFARDPNTAALDVVRYVESEVGGEPGAVITLTADGTEPWARYSDSGVAFLESLFRLLAASELFNTALPGELESALLFDPGPFPPLPDSYLQQSDELAAWAYLGETRRELLRAQQVGEVGEQAIDSAYDLILQAQDATWYWWYGEDRSSGEDGYYDTTFRAKLEKVWRLLDAQPPSWAQVPLGETLPVLPDRIDSGATDIVIDNNIADAEWAAAGLYEDRAAELLRRLYYTVDERDIHLRVDFASEVLGDSAPAFDLYLGTPAGSGAPLTPDGLGLGFEADRVLRWRSTNPVRVSSLQPYPGSFTGDATIEAGFDGDSIEFTIPLESIASDLRPGDKLDIRLVDATGGPERSLFPSAGRGSIEIPNAALGTELVSIADQPRDDHGPGSYTYVIDSELRAFSFDLAGLVVRVIGGPTQADPDAPGEVQFEISFNQPLTNPWSAPAGFSHPTIDLYLEAYPGTDTGARRLLPGRVAALEGEAGWDYAFTIDGWDGRQFLADTAGAIVEIDSPLEYVLLSDRKTILITVDRALLPPGDETAWQFGVGVLANQAIPSLGIHRLSPLSTVPGRFQLGGGTGAVNDPRFIDVLEPEAGRQEQLLTYPRAIGTGDPADVAIEDLAQLPLLGPR